MPDAAPFDYSGERAAGGLVPARAASAPARIGLSGAGRLIDWEILNRPAKGVTNGISPLRGAGRAGRRGASTRASSTAPISATGPATFPADTSRNFGFGARRDSLAGMPHFADNTLRGPLPGRRACGSRTAHFPGPVDLIAFNPFIPLERARLEHARSRCSRSRSPTRPTTRSTTPRSASSATASARRPRPSRVTGDGMTGVQDRHRRARPRLAGLCRAGARDRRPDDQPPGAPLSRALVRRARGLLEGPAAARPVRRRATTAPATLRRRHGPQPRQQPRRSACRGAAGRDRARSASSSPGTRRTSASTGSPRSGTSARPRAPPASGRTGTRRNGRAPSRSPREVLARWDELERRDLRLPRRALRLDPAACRCSTRPAANLSILKSPTTLRLEDGTFYGWEGCHPDRRQLRGQLHPRLELPAGAALPVPRARALDARGRLRLQHGRGRRHELPPQPAARHPLLDRAALRRRPVRRHPQALSRLEAVGRHWTGCAGSGRAPSGASSTPGARTTRTAGTPTRPASCGAASTTRSTWSCSGPTPGSPASTSARSRPAAEMADALGEHETRRAVPRRSTSGAAPGSTHNLFNGEYFVQQLDLGDRSVLAPFAETEIAAGRAGRRRRAALLEPGAQAAQVPARRRLPHRPGARPVARAASTAWATSSTRDKVATSLAVDLPPQLHASGWATSTIPAACSAWTTSPAPSSRPGRTREPQARGAGALRAGDDARHGVRLRPDADAVRHARRGRAGHRGGPRPL